MSKYDYFIQIEQLKVQNPHFAEALKEAIKERKKPGWIRGMIERQTHATFSTKEVRNYLLDVWSPKRRATALAAWKAAITDAGQEEAQSPARPEGADTAQAGETSITPRPTGGGRYRVDDEDIFGELDRQLRLMLDEALANPESDAAKMLEILAFRQLKLDRTKAQEMDFMKFYAEQSRRRAAEASVAAAEARLMEAQNKLWDVQDGAEEAVAEGRPFNWEEAFDQISAVIGFGQPQQQEAAAEASTSEETE